MRAVNRYRAFWPGQKKVYNQADACRAVVRLFLLLLAAAAVCRMLAVMAVFLAVVAAFAFVFAVVAMLIFAAAATFFVCAASWFLVCFFVAAALRGARYVMVWHIISSISY